MIGRRNRRIVIEERTGATDAAGQPLDTWTEHAKRWAEVKGLTGLGVLRGSDGVTASSTGYSFRIRFTKSITTDMRIVDVDGSVYDITKIQHDLDRKEWTDLVTNTGANDG